MVGNPIAAPARVSDFRKSRRAMDMEKRVFFMGEERKLKERRKD